MLEIFIFIKFLKNVEIDIRVLENCFCLIVSFVNILIFFLYVDLKEKFG